MAAPQKIRSALRGLAADTEELIEEVADHSHSRVDAAEDSARAAVSAARRGLAMLAQRGTTHVCAAGDVACDYVHKNTWKIIAGAAIIGIVAGVLLTRR